MKCTVDNCGETAALHYVWAWGEEGVCCTEHRASLEGTSARVGRAIAFTSIAEGGLRKYTTPKISQMDPELGALRARCAELTSQLEEKDRRILELEEQVARFGESESVIEG